LGRLAIQAIDKLETKKENRTGVFGMWNPIINSRELAMIKEWIYNNKIRI
jgi:hypothetical protein